MSAYSEILRYLYGLQARGMKYGLRNIKVLMESVGHPERSFPSIHIAGTNGKGSTASFLASVFAEAGYKTGLYTSPHLLRFTERIRINGIEIPERRLVEYARRLRTLTDRTGATFFEATTCIAFQYFADEHVDIAIVETGLGGRLDATNVLRPLVSVITNIDLDHQEYLGFTIRSIAREKGGIIKRGVPCVTGSRNAEVLGVLRSIAGKKGTAAHEASRLVRLTTAPRAGGRPWFGFQSKALQIRRGLLGLEGEHQGANARLALAALELLFRTDEGRRKFSPPAPDVVSRALARVKENTGLRGRLELVGGRYLLDVAHNPAGIQTALNSLRKRPDAKCVVVFGAMRDKDVREMLRCLAGVSRVIIAVTPHIERALPSSDIVAIGNQLNISMVDGGSIAGGLRKAARYRGGASPVFVTGSHYVVGEALGFLQRRGLA